MSVSSFPSCNYHQACNHENVIMISEGFLHRNSSWWTWIYLYPRQFEAQGIVVLQSEKWLCSCLASLQKSLQFGAVFLHCKPSIKIYQASFAQNFVSLLLLVFPPAILHFSSFLFPFLFIEMNLQMCLYT